MMPTMKLAICLCLLALALSACGGDSSSESTDTSACLPGEPSPDCKPNETEDE